VQLSEALRDGIRVRETRLRALPHERTNGCGKNSPESARLDRTDV